MVYVELAVKHVPLLIGLFLLVLFGWMVKNVLSTSREWSTWSADTTTYFTAVDVQRIVRDSVDADNARDSVVTQRLLAVAERNKQGRLRLESTVDSLGEVMRQAHNAPESLLIALETNQNLLGALGEAQGEIVALRGVYEAQSLVLTRLKVSEAQAWRLIDSASSVIRRVPQPCRIPVVGIKCPTVVVGGVVTRQGLDVGVAFGFPL